MAKTRKANLLCAYGVAREALPAGARKEEGNSAVRWAELRDLIMAALEPYPEAAAAMAEALAKQPNLREESGLEKA